MDRKETLKVISIKDLWDLLVRKLPVMILAAVVSVAIFWGISTVTYEPLYESTATLYILRQSDDGTSSGDASSDFSLALKVVNDCTFLLKSHSVLDEVIAGMDLDMSYQQLYNAVSTSNPDNTRILQVTVRAASPELAQRIVDLICELGKETITNAMGFEQVNLFEHGIRNDVPCNRTSMAVYALLGAMAAVTVYLIFLVVFILDDSIKTNEDIERYLGMSVLGEIPNAKDASRYHDGRYAYGPKNKSR